MSKLSASVTFAFSKMNAATDIMIASSALLAIQLGIGVRSDAICETWFGCPKCLGHVGMLAICHLMGAFGLFSS